MTVVVVGTTWVMVNSWVTNIVDTTVEGGSWVVSTTVEPGRVVTTVWAGNVTVDINTFVTVLAGSCVVNVVVIPGRVIVESTVEAGS